MFKTRPIPKVSAVACLAAVLVFGACISCHAYALDTTLIGDLGHFSLHSEVTQAGSVYTYSYRLTFDSGPTNAEVFSVENWPDDLPFSNASHTDGFIWPVYSPGFYEVKWTDGTLAPGQTLTFSYDSIYSYCEIPVSAYVLDGGLESDGTALGMASTVPEPSAFVGLAMAMAGLVPSLIRKRRRAA